MLRSGLEWEPWCSRLPQPGNQHPQERAEAGYGSPAPAEGSQSRSREADAVGSPPTWWLVFETGFPAPGRDLEAPAHGEAAVTSPQQGCAVQLRGQEPCSRDDPSCLRLRAAGFSAGRRVASWLLLVPGSGPVQSLALSLPALSWLWAPGHPALLWFSE